MFGIQGVWNEQRFPLSSYEVSGFWSYRLAGEAAAISVFGCEVEITGWRARDSSGNSLSLAHSGVGLSRSSMGLNRSFLWVFGVGVVSFYR
ncbi:hypothetical protein IGI04_006207 [Brassica rapa subsp. trilocularis]|uniref:Uncharacterized protein n=1 Tax=Brassica rapa subsp. trilocularis TaxID=1813537 RepID=A0ABQ7NGN7_BRACM|nr:hypothetical protein IGI04_006207 [Brassica rapa subsp. trilocularis]